jgi:simple sugar transport system permease protein
MSSSIAAAPSRSLQMRLRRFGVDWASQIGITVAFAALWLLFIVGAPSTFLSDRIYLAFAQTTPYFSIVALFLTMVIIAGDIDLSFTSEMSLGMVGFTFAWQASGSAELGFVAAIAVGALCGLFNGLIVTRIGIPSLVATIGTQFLFGGLTLVLVNGKSYPLVDTNGSAIYWLLVGKIGSIPMEFPWFLALTVVAWVLLNRHRLGHNAYVIGDNRQAAQLMGVPIGLTRIMLFVLVGMAAALAGMMNSLSLNNFFPNVGSGYLLITLAAVFIGGTSVFGGRGTVYGTFLGAFMMGGLQAGIVAMGLTAYLITPVEGAIVLVAVSIHAILQQRFK